MSYTINEEYLLSLGSLIYGMCHKFYWSKGLNKKVFLDEEIFSLCLVDIFHDLRRLSDFHEIDHPSLAKIMAYSASWIARRKPLQMIQGYDSNDDRYKFINEKLALFILLRGSEDLVWRYPSDSQKKACVKKLIQRLLYHLIYRDSNAQTLELLLNGIEFGMLVNSN